jgi:ferric-dicitrate binding protein FerR (iron transport regulator)
MNIQDNQHKVDEAWLSLHSRLQRDGLLSATAETENISGFRVPAVRWFAGIAAACIGLIIAFSVYKSNDKPSNWVTAQNTDAKVNLVTTLSDGSVVYLAEQASLSYSPQLEEDKREVFLRGEAFFDIERIPGKPFVIETDLANIEVLGTAFCVKSNEGKPFSLSVLRGKVSVTLKKGGASSPVEAGQTALLKANGLETIPTADKTQFAKYTGRLHFKDRRLADIVRVINANSDSTRIELSPGIENRLLTVTFIDESVSSMAELMALALNLQYRHEKNTVLLYELK